MLGRGENTLYQVSANDPGDTLPPPPRFQPRTPGADQGSPGGCLGVKVARRTKGSLTLPPLHSLSRSQSNPSPPSKTRWALKQSTHRAGTDMKTGPYASGETGRVGPTATFSLGPSASSCPGPGPSAWEHCSSPLSWAAGRLGISSLDSNKEATVLKPEEGERLQVYPIQGQRSVMGTKEAAALARPVVSLSQVSDPSFPPCLSPSSLH